MEFLGAAADASSSACAASKFLMYLTFNGELDEVLQHFGPNEEYCDMLSYLWNLDKFHTLCPLPAFVSIKNETLAKSFGKEGNQYHKERCLDKALTSYNQCIIYAEPSKSSKSENYLAYGYGNRSAVLFELGQYEKCLKDIARSIEAGYPEEKKGKLLERKTKAENALKERVKNSPGELISKMKKLQVSSDLGFLPEFKPLSECCTEKLPFNGKGKNVKHTYRHLCNNDKIEIPELKSTNRKVPCLTSSADIGYSKQKGRYIYATKDIYPDEVIIKERALGLSLFTPYTLTNCSYCHIVSMIPLPCPTCSKVVFCSDECLTEGLSCFHSAECVMLPTLLSLDPENIGICSLIVRLIIKMPFAELKKTFALLKEETRMKKPLMKGFNEEGVYSSQDYRTMYHLLNHREKQSPKALLQACCNVLLILKVFAWEGNYVGQKLKLKVLLCLPTDFLVLGEILFRHYLAMQCNPYRHNQFNIDDEYNLSAVHISMCASSLVSLVNHSCCATAVGCNYGTMIVCKAKEFIPTGGEISVSYVGPYQSLERSYRQKHLFENFHFNCDCDACKYNWPKNPTSPRSESTILRCPILRCPHCRGDLHVNFGCIKCNEKIFYILPHLNDEKNCRVTSRELHQIILNALRDGLVISTCGIQNAQDYQIITKGISLLCLYAKRPSLEPKLQGCLLFYNIARSFHCHAVDL